MDQFFDIGKVQAGCRLVQDVERFSARAFGQLIGQFDALSFAPGQGIAGLPELDIAHADIVQQLQRLRDLWHPDEKRRRLFNRHIQHIGDVLAVIGDFQGLLVIAPATAHIAADVDIGQEAHLHFNASLSGTGLAAPPLHIEREPTGFIAAQAAHRAAAKRACAPRPRSPHRTPGPNAGFSQWATDRLRPRALSPRYCQCCHADRPARRTARVCAAAR